MIPLSQVREHVINALHPALNAMVKKAQNVVSAQLGSIYSHQQFVLLHALLEPGRMLVTITAILVQDVLPAILDQANVFLATPVLISTP